MHPGEKIRALRKERGLSVEELAEEAGVSARHLYRVEAGETRSPGLRFLSDVADALEVDVGELAD